MKIKSVSILVAIATAAWTDAVAQSDSGDRYENVGIDEVTVTATKRETSLQDTPMAISAFKGEALEARGIDELLTFQSYVPGLHVGQEQDGFKIALRGIGLQGTSSITDPGVAFYIDNLYIPRPAGGSAIFYDIDRIEVLRGPQGTLYGRNATGGVINVISNEPSYDNEMQFGATVGNQSLLEARAVGNFAFSDAAAARISVVRSEEDGYVTNTSGANDGDDPFGSHENLTVRGQLLLVAPGDLDVLLSGTYSDLQGTGVAYHFLERNLGGPPPTQALVMTLPPDPVDPLTVANDASAWNDTETRTAFARVEKRFEGFDGFLQIGKIWQDTDIQQDFDGSPVDVSIFNKLQENEAESAEFRLSSSDPEGMQWILGAYYFSEDTYIFRRVRLNGLTPGGMINLPDFLLDEFGSSSTIGAFGNATWPIGDTLRFSAGLRYTEDTKEGSLFNASNFGLPTRPDLVDVKEEFSKTDWKVGLEWDVADATLAYLNVSTGYKAGGFNITSNGAPYDEENVLAYEIGLKSRPTGRRAQINVDTFYYQYEDMQLTTLTTINNAPGQFTTNAAESTIYGLEVESQYEFSDALLGTLTYAYVNAEFDEYYNTDPRDPNPVFNPDDPEGLGRENLGGNKVPYVPEHTLTLGVRYAADVGQGQFVVSANTSWHSEFYLREYNHPDIDRVGSQSKSDISATWHVGDSGFSVTGFVTNLEDDVEKINIYISPGFIGTSATTVYSKPRTYGLKLDYQF